jgi:hypothetical protein
MKYARGSVWNLVAAVTGVGLLASGHAFDGAEKWLI